MEAQTNASKHITFSAYFVGGGGLKIIRTVTGYTVSIILMMS